jgi:hypothetical protein
MVQTLRLYLFTQLQTAVSSINEARKALNNECDIWLNSEQKAERDRLSGKFEREYLPWLYFFSGFISPNSFEQATQ